MAGENSFAKHMAQELLTCPRTKDVVVQQSQKNEKCELQLGEMYGFLCLPNIFGDPYKIKAPLIMK